MKRMSHVSGPAPTCDIRFIVGLHQRDIGEIVENLALRADLRQRIGDGNMKAFGHGRFRDGCESLSCIWY
jgi:hypothetical protein